MIWPFKQKIPPLPVVNVIEDTTFDRQRALAVQRAKLRRAHDLKRRSSAVAASLREEATVNHYAERLRLAYLEGQR